MLESSLHTQGRCGCGPCYVLAIVGFEGCPQQIEYVRHKLRAKVGLGRSWS